MIAEMDTPDENYFCHIVIPARDYQRSAIFYQKVFGWEVQATPGMDSLDITPPSGRGPSAELNASEESIVPAIFTADIEGKLALIEQYGGRRLQGRTPIGQNAELGYYALFEDPYGSRMCLYSEK